MCNSGKIFVGCIPPGIKVKIQAMLLSNNVHKLDLQILFGLNNNYNQFT
jgi:hypothetical protein